jgi:NAD(P)-dependent dehydrogenase (short-subunit alcohol dehydrogenase family)
MTGQRAWCHGQQVGGAGAHGHWPAISGPYNIRVNAIAPGWILTERQRKLWLNAERHADLMKAQCLKRYLVVDDISRVVLFLSSDEAGAITSQHYVVDGGRL